MNYVPPRRSDGTIQTRRVPQPWPKDRPFRILSIDGGGICGILPAAVLAELEQRYLQGQSIGDYFDRSPVLRQVASSLLGSDTVELLPRSETFTQSGEETFFHQAQSWGEWFGSCGKAIAQSTNGVP